MNLIHLPNVLEKVNSELENIKKEKISLENEKEKINEEFNLDDFKKYSNFLITHIDILALDKEKPELINLSFDFVFGGKMEYEKLGYHTNFLNTFSTYLSQQKNPSCDEFCQNTKWHPHKESNLARRIWNPAF